MSGLGCTAAVNGRHACTRVLASSSGTPSLAASSGTDAPLRAASAGSATPRGLGRGDMSREALSLTRPLLGTLGRILCPALAALCCTLL